MYAKTVEDALSGLGGLHDPGRWHSKGRKIVYTSASSTLCLLERLVHADEWIAERHRDRVMLTLALPSVSYFWYQAAELAARDSGWRIEGNAFCRNLGDAWLAGGAACALMVPSAADQSAFNILLNPLHPEFSAVLAANTPLNRAAIELDERVVSLAQSRRRSGP